MEVNKQMHVDKIYFDMDSVLADFNRGVRELCGMEPPWQDTESGKDADDQMWARIKECDHFYDKLELMPGAKEMFDRVYGKYGNKCEILTAVPKPKRGILTAGDDKIKWVRRLLSDEIKVNIVVKEEKANFCKGEESILIDDLKGNVEAWESYGGTGLLHSSSEDTVKTLESMGII